MTPQILNQLKKNSQGFTVVKLLIVIVIIVILAITTTVTYSNTKNRTKTSSAQSAATTVLKKAQAYNAETAAYPITFTTLTEASSTATYRLTGVASVASLTNGTPTSNIKFEVCGSGTPTPPNLTAITASNVTGVRVSYRNYAEGSSNLTLQAGITSGSAVACFNSIGNAT